MVSTKFSNMKHHNKLVRDKIPEILRQEGISFQERTAAPEEMLYLLVDKLREETREFAEKPNVKELADILEVVIALSQIIAPEGGRGLLELVCNEKFEERGGFSERIVLISTDETS